MSSRLLPIGREIDFPKVRTFLESIARNSRNSKASYEAGLKHLQHYLGARSNASTLFPLNDRLESHHDSVC